MLNKLKKIKPKHILEMLVILISFIPGMILRLIKRDIWIVAENGDDAKDNGYAFFKYAMENKSKKDIYYVITKKSIYYDKLKKYNKNLLYKNSLKHNIYTIASTKYISSQIGSGLPFPELVFNFQGTFIYRFKSIFLQHGITQNKVQCLLKNESKVDLFCCAGNKEYDFVINELGYNEENAKKTGFCRYDLLKDESKENNKILMMFTWRKQFENDEKTFLDSKYYSTIQDLIKDTRLSDLLEKENLELYMCLHDNMIPYKDKFITTNSRIKIVDKTEKSIQELLRECKYLITDYSSVAFDFAYMKKPLQYFQFDYEEFRKNHIPEGYWNYEDGFGEVTHTVDECINKLIESVNCNFEMNEKYKNKTKDFYIYTDTENSKRTYEEIEKLPVEKHNIDSVWLITVIAFIISFFTKNLYLLLITDVIGVILNIIYSSKNISQRIYLLIFNIAMFTFLLAKPVISIFKAINWIEKFSIDSQQHAFLLVFIATFSIYIGSRISEKKNKITENIKENTNESKCKDKKIFTNIALVLFLVCAIFSIITEYDKLIYMNGKDYVEYYLTYENTFNPIITLLAGMSDIMLCIFLACMPSKKKAIIPVGIFMIYNIPTFLIGQRTPIVISALFIFSYFVIRDYLNNKERWIGKFEKIALILLIPVAIIGLAIYNYSRVDEEVPTTNIISLFGDFFYTQGVSYDVLNIGYEIKDKIKTTTNHNYTFGPFIDYFKYSTISQKIFKTKPLPTGNNVTKALESSSYSHIISYLTRKDYLEGHGWGSSFILETYTDFGYIGVIVYSLILGYLLMAIPRLLKKNTFIASIVLISTLNIFIIPRAEALQFLQFIITPQFWGAWIMCICGYQVVKIIINKYEMRKN